MKIGVIVAMGKELKMLLPLMESSPEVIEESGYNFYRGRIGENEIIVMQCGIGKVNSALGTLKLIEIFQPDHVINTGVAGGADASMKVLDIFIATEVAYHDVWCGPGTEYGAAAGLDVFMRPDSSFITKATAGIFDSSKLKLGLICSGDKFISTAEEIADIKSHFPAALAVDMESASIAQVCMMKKVPFNIVRVISDTPGQEENISQYENFWTDAPAENFKVLERVFK